MAYRHPAMTLHELSPPDTSENPPGTRYYVSCNTEPRIPNAGLYGIVYGPFDTYAEAEKHVGGASSVAERSEPRAAWWSFGVCAIKDSSIKITPAFNLDWTQNAGKGTCFKKG